VTPRIALLASFPFLLCGQWTLQDSHSKASLRGIHSVGGGVAWASGTGGTVLRTTDDGRNWQTCAIPPGAEKLDFRAVQAFDARTALVMSIGTGDLSRIYKTTDGCATWKLVFSNPDKEGFWDAMRFGGKQGVLLGDPVGGRFPIFVTRDGGDMWQRPDRPAIPAAEGQAIFAASNTSLLLMGGGRKFAIVTGGSAASWMIASESIALPLATGASAGAFSVASSGRAYVAVGGDYKLPDQGSGTAVYWTRKGPVKPAEKQPHGYRSAVAYDASSKTWIAVGPNGTDVSTDNGRTWSPRAPGPGDSPDADRNWNALSLPFVVGPQGRIGKMR
jgi:photosystem II stability/assembly factor-like uncharacterized protein